MQKKIIEKLKQKLETPLVLIGMMGTGKSHAGRLLGKALDVPFYDSDFLIEQRQNQKISEIFEQHGEKFFRQVEAEVILEILKTAPCVVSLGGGAVTTPEILQDIQNSTVSIWLKADVQTILRRVAHDKNRPLLAGQDREERLKQLLAVRTPLYALADVAIENEGVGDMELLDKLYKALADFWDLS